MIYKPLNYLLNIKLRKKKGKNMYNRDYLSNQSSQYTQESSKVQLMSF